MKLPRPFFQPLAIGAPAPLRELPVRLERMIHFVPPHVEKLRAKVPQLISEVDVVLGNLEDAIPADAKQAARDGFIAMARENDFVTTGLWTRINALNSPWALDDLTAIVAAIGNKLDVVMLPKVDGAWDVHYLDQFLAQLEARHDIKKPILIHAILETAEGVNNVEAIASASIVDGPMRVLSFLAGIVGLVFVVIMVIGDGGNPAVFGPIGHGGAERMIVYPAMLWLMAFGGYLMAGPGGLALTRTGVGRPAFHDA